MDVLKVSLEALLQRATNPNNQNVDIAAVEAFCALINKEKEGPTIGIKLLAAQIHSKNEQEVLQALHILDYGMQKCGVAFQSEVGKFRFLNEMIKLVSPKYLGCHTPLSVKQKVLQLMYLWTLDYPNETKIKEANDMLKKQGVIKDIPLSICSETMPLPERKNTIFQDDEKSKLLKKLLQSKNPEDLQAANRLIKTMVKEDEKKAELKSKRITILESVQNNIRLLNEMLDSYKPGHSSQDEYDLIKELHESCERLRPSIIKLASETQQNDDILGDILRVNDEFGQVFDKYTSIILKEETTISSSDASQLSLLDLSGSSSSNLSLLQNTTASTASSPPPTSQPQQTQQQQSTNVDDLCDILTMPIVASETNDETILKPVNVGRLDAEINGDMSEKTTSNNKLKALEDLDALGECLLKQNLQSINKIASFNNKEKIPMNLLSKSAANEASEKKPSAALDFDLSNFLEAPTPPVQVEADTNKNENDDLLVDITELNSDLNAVGDNNKDVVECNKGDVKLSEISLDLKNIKPDNAIKPIIALEEKNGVTVILNFAKDKPHEDVGVIVVTIINKNELPIKNVLFRAIVPKSCKVKLQPPSASELPAFNPFLPPAAITQVLLIANPTKVQVALKFIVSYNVDDETMTEMGEVESLPNIF